AVVLLGTCGDDPPSAAGRGTAGGGLGGTPTHGGLRFVGGEVRLPEQHVLYLATARVVRGVVRVGQRVVEADERVRADVLRTHGEDGLDRRAAERARDGRHGPVERLDRGRRQFEGVERCVGLGGGSRVIGVDERDGQ